MVSVVQREWAAKNPRAIFKDPITVVIVSLGLVRFRRAAAPIEAKIRSIGTMQLPHSHRILLGSVLVSRCRMSLRGLATPDLDLIKQVEEERRTATSSDFAVVAVDGQLSAFAERPARAAWGSFMIHVRHAAAAIAAGLCETVLITHGESGRSGVGRTRNVVAPTSLAGPPPFPPPQAGEG